MSKSHSVKTMKDLNGDETASASPQPHETQSVVSTASNDSDGEPKTRGPNKCRLPLFCAFVPQLLVIIVICVVSTLTFVGVYTDGTDSAAKEWLAEAILLLEHRLVDPLAEAHTDINNVKEIVFSSGAVAYNDSFSSRVVPDFERYSPFYHACRSLIYNKGGRYSVCIQKYAHSDPFPSLEDRPEAVPLQKYPEGFAGCGESTCIFSGHMPNATFEINFFDGGWLGRYPSKVSKGIVRTISNFRHTTALVYDGSINYDTDHIYWKTEVATDPLSGETYVVFRVIAPILLAPPEDGAPFQRPLSYLQFSVNAQQVLKTLLLTTNVTSSHYAIMDLDADVFIVANYPGFAGFDDGVQNKSVTDRFEYIVQPSLVHIQDVPHALLKRAISTIVAPIDGDGGVPSASSLSATLTTIPKMDFDSLEDFIVTSSALRTFDLNIGMVMTTDEELFRQRIRSATSKVIAVTVGLFVFAMIASIATAFVIVRPIEKTSRYVHRVSMLRATDSLNENESQSIFSELASLQQASHEMGSLLLRLKCFVPQTVMQVTTNSQGPSSGSISGLTTVSGHQHFPTVAASPSNPLAPTAHHQRQSDGSSSSTTMHMDSIPYDAVGVGGCSTSDENNLLSLNVDRLAVKENVYKSAMSTMLVVQLNLQHDPAVDLPKFSVETTRFMRSSLPHILRGKGVVELQRPDLVVAMFDHGVHAERAAQCAVKVSKACKAQHLKVNMLVHSGMFLVGACGSQGRVSFVQYNIFFYSAIRILEFTRRCLQPNTLVVTDSVAKSLPPSLIAVPIENLVGCCGPQQTSITLHQVFHVKSEGPNTIRKEALRMKQIFSDMSQRRYTVLLDNRQLAGAVEDDAEEGTLPFSTTAPQLQHHVSRLERIASLLSSHKKGEQPPSFERRFVGWTIDGMEMCDDSQGADYHCFKASSKLNDDANVGKYPHNDICSPMSSMNTGKVQVTSASISSSSDPDEGSPHEKLRQALRIVGEDSSVQQVAFPPDDEHTREENSAPLVAMASVSSRSATEISTAQVSSSTSRHEETSGFIDGVVPCHHGSDDLSYIPPQFLDIHNNSWLTTPDEKLLGEGAFSKVFLGMNAQGDMVALKCIDINKSASSCAVGYSTEALETEVSVLSAAHHPNVAAFISVAVHKSLLILVLEYVSGGTLRGVIGSFGSRLPRTAVRRFALDIVKGLHYLHMEKNIIHGDIKPENVLVATNSVCKLTDFGSAVENIYASKKDDVGAGDSVFDIRGTAPYMAPEVAAGNLPTPASDIWSFGILLHELVTGVLPWEPSVAKSQVKLMRGLAKKPGQSGAIRPSVHHSLQQHRSGGNVHGGNSFLTATSSSSSSADADREMALEIIKACLQEAPDDRPTVKSLLQHFTFLL